MSLFETRLKHDVGVFKCIPDKLGGHISAYYGNAWDKKVPRRHAETPSDKTANGDREHIPRR